MAHPSSGSTIVAQATPVAAGGVGIVRISGALALELSRRFAPDVPHDVEPRRAVFTRFVDPAGVVLDQGLFLYFRAPHSFTGEDVVELHAHGSPRLLQLLQAELLADGRVRLAEPGEFSRRAYLNGRIDLVRAEAIADLVAAESVSAVRAAAAQLAGELSAKVGALRLPLLALRTDMEGVLNFPEEAEGADEHAAERLAPIIEGAKALLEGATRGRLVRRGANVVLFGPVNAGKSTLFNRLVGEERAIVDAEPGTTRDVLEARVELEGLTLALFDTAGLRGEGAGRIEQLGMTRARAALAAADLAVLVVPPEASGDEATRWKEEAAAHVEVLVVQSKSDLSPALPGRHAVSGVTGEGIEALRRALVEKLWAGGAPGAVALISERHADALRRAVGSLERACDAVNVSTLEVVSGELGLALEALGEITGESAVPELLDAIFRRFCIGK